MKTKRNHEFRYLLPTFHKKVRQNSIDTEYINGVYDQKGKQVIRPLNTEEKQWLDNYYKENLAFDFDRTKLTEEELQQMDMLNNSKNRDILNLNGCPVTLNKKGKKIQYFINNYPFDAIYYENYVFSKTQHLDYESILIDKVEKLIKHKEDIKPKLVKTKVIRRKASQLKQLDQEQQ